MVFLYEAVIEQVKFEESFYMFLQLQVINI